MDQYPKQPQMGAPPQPGMGYPAPAPHGIPHQVQAPYVMPQVQPWSTGLCDCMDDVSNCCITWWCPCITFGQIAEIADRGTTSCGTAGAMYMLLMMLTGCQWIYSCMYRQRFRMEHGLNEEPCADCCVHFCCEPCALCQMSRELKNRGWDLNLGYILNVERRAMAQQQTAPPPMQGMMR